MKFDVITIFPEIISDYSKISIIARGIAKKIISIVPHDLRDFTKDAHHTVDDRPYGGGVGMVLKPDIMQKAISKVAGRLGRKLRPIKSQQNPKKQSRIIMLSPQGKTFNQAHAKRLAKYDQLILICGRYEGFDERIRDMVDEEISLGDFVLMGGELPALVVIEAVSRFVPGVVGKSESTELESFSRHPLYGALLEYPQYTRPEQLLSGNKKSRVPKILLSGDHAKIQDWRLGQALKRTKKRRPDLLKAASI